jgi:deoxyribodipyrimidine photolyase
LKVVCSTMICRKQVLFWFREHLELEGHHGLCKALNEASTIIPVYCFDPREAVIDPVTFSSSIKKQVDAVISLRAALMQRGSNLLVVEGYFEKIIPSLARVLQVQQVVTHIYMEGKGNKLADFRWQKAGEVAQLLNMHSIPVLFEGPCLPDDKLPVKFPGFPEIEPGSIPYKYR